MVYHSIPDPNKTCPDQMTNFEFIRTEISKVYFNSDNTLINLVEATQTIIYPREVDLSRAEVIELMKKQGSNIYFNNRILILDQVNGTPYIHHEKSNLLRDILE
jgi:uncharacterized protein YqgQ